MGWWMEKRKKKDSKSHRSRYHEFQASSYGRVSCCQGTWPSNYTCWFALSSLGRHLGVEFGMKFQMKWKIKNITSNRSCSTQDIIQGMLSQVGLRRAWTSSSSSKSWCQDHSQLDKNPIHAKQAKETRCHGCWQKSFSSVRFVIYPFRPMGFLWASLSKE